MGMGLATLGCHAIGKYSIKGAMKRVNLSPEETKELQRIADHLRVGPREALRRVILITCAALEDEDGEARHRALQGGEAAGHGEHQPQPGGGETDAPTR
jgi:hypothetical protein